MVGDDVEEQRVSITREGLLDPGDELHDERLETEHPRRAREDEPDGICSAGHYGQPSCAYRAGLGAARHLLRARPDRRLRPRQGQTQPLSLPRVPRLREQTVEGGERDAEPVRSVARLVHRLVERLVELERP